jgi:hypothetical protein
MIALATCAAFSSCDEGFVTNPDQIIMPDSEVSFNRHIQPVFDLSCALSGCHDEFTQAGGLSLRSYSDVLASPGLVSPGDSTASVLRQVVRGVLPHIAYPMNELLTENHKKGIAIWIQEGASNN